MLDLIFLNLSSARSCCCVDKVDISFVSLTLVACEAMKINPFVCLVPLICLTRYSDAFQRPHHFQPTCSCTTFSRATTNYHPAVHASTLLSSKDITDEDAPFTRDSIIQETSRLLRRVSWLSWWSQVILTTVSAVILLFAKNVATRYGNAIQSPPFILSGVGVIISGISILWTYADGARLSSRILRAERSQASKWLTRAVRVGVSLNLVGLMTTLVAAEQIVGTLAVKVLTQRNFMTTVSTEAGLQPLDILIVQANTNTLLSHFCSLVAFLYLTDQIRKLNLQRKP